MIYRDLCKILLCCLNSRIVEVLYNEIRTKKYKNSIKILIWIFIVRYPYIDRKFNESQENRLRYELIANIKRRQ